MLVIVPDYLRDAIYAAIDKELDGRECDEETREYIYSQILLHYKEQGVIPSFSLSPSPSSKGDATP